MNLKFLKFYQVSYFWHGFFHGFMGKTNTKLEFLYILNSIRNKKLIYIWILQPGGDGQGLTVFLENSVSAKDVWTLTDSWSDQTGWIDGRVEIKASELAGDTIFRVNKTR